jgi:hypothetical protein
MSFLAVYNKLFDKKINSGLIEKNLKLGAFTQKIKVLKKIRDLLIAKKSEKNSEHSFPSEILSGGLK